MITVDIIDLHAGVCEACDINSIFNTKNFTRYCKRLQNENNETGKKRKEESRGVTDCRASDQMGTRDCEMSELL